MCHIYRKIWQFWEMNIYIFILVVFLWLEENHSELVKYSNSYHVYSTAFQSMCSSTFLNCILHPEALKCFISPSANTTFGKIPKYRSHRRHWYVFVWQHFFLFLFLIAGNISYSVEYDFAVQWTQIDISKWLGEQVGDGNQLMTEGEKKWGGWWLDSILRCRAHLYPGSFQDFVRKDLMFNRFNVGKME